MRDKHRVPLEIVVTASFLDTVMKKFHFAQEDLQQLEMVGQSVEEAVRGAALFWCVSCESLRADSGRENPTGSRMSKALAASFGVSEEEMSDLALVAMTLGAGVDALQETYTAAGHLLECYMAEALAGELLLHAYRQFNRWMETHSGQHVARYLFFGAGGAAPGLEAMQESLRALGATEVHCNSACCLSPKKSVVFLAKLTGDPAVRCEGICVGCGQENCPNRCAGEPEAGRLSWPDLVGRALPYGYARILGR